MEIVIEKKQNDIINGVAGAIAGAVIGAAPWFLMEVTFGIRGGLLGFIIVFASSACYKKFGGTGRKPEYISVIIFSAISIIIAAFFAFLLTARNTWNLEMGTELNLFDTFDVLVGAVAGSSDFKKYFIFEMIWGISAGFISGWLAFSRIKRRDRVMDEIREIQENALKDKDQNN